MLWFRQLQFVCGNSFWLFLLRTHRTWHTHDFNCSWVVSWAPILQMPIYYLFPELAIRREGSGNSTEISTDSLVQADMAGSSSSRRKKKTRQGKCFHVFKLRKQGGTVIFSVKQVDRYKLSLSVGVRAARLKCVRSCCLKNYVQVMKWVIPCHWLSLDYAGLFFIVTLLSVTFLWGGFQKCINKNKEAQLFNSIFYSFSRDLIGGMPRVHLQNWKTKEKFNEKNGRTTGLMEPFGQVMHLWTRPHVCTILQSRKVESWKYFTFFYLK